MTQSDDNRQSVGSSILIALIAQVGCLTLFIILGSLLGGLWLDRTFGTKPFFTLILLLAGTPLSVVVMLLVSRRTVARIRSQAEKKDDRLSS
jgi:F0F1-type ATP synthase assembly protein I